MAEPFAFVLRMTVNPRTGWSNLSGACGVLSHPSLPGLPLFRSRAFCFALQNTSPLPPIWHYHSCRLTCVDNASTQVRPLSLPRCLCVPLRAGFLGWLCYCAMGALAYESVRRARFELFYYAHITLVSPFPSI